MAVLQLSCLTGQSFAEAVDGVHLFLRENMTADRIYGRQSKLLKKGLGKLALYTQEGVSLHSDVDSWLLLLWRFFRA
jgi:hypothetical protein